jgi:hypothetical protein
MSSYCYAHLPKSGLGNKLLVWARGMVFAHLNQLPFFSDPWGELRPGPLLRGERDRLFYFGFFKDDAEPAWLEKARARYLLPKIVEPEIAVQPIENNKLYYFDAMPHWADYFKGIHQHRDLVRSRLRAMIHPRMLRRLKELETAPPPVIGINVRLSHFLKLPPGATFRGGGFRTPLEYFQNLIENIRRFVGAPWPVTIFSDGYDQDLEPLLKLPGVTRSPLNPAIIDLHLLARSRVVVASSGSTFSHWAIFLSDAPGLRHPVDQVDCETRPVALFPHLFEGAVTGPCESWPALLQENLRKVQRDLQAVTAR